jgi:serine/threonine protein kinase
MDTLKLGGGAFGDIYCCTHKMRPALAAAVKITRPTVLDTKGKGPIKGYDEIESRCQEIKALRKLQEERGKERERAHILQLYEYFWKGSHLHIVTERLGKDLYSWIKDHSNFTEQIAKGVAKRLLQAIKFMHERGVVHRDLKPYNILFKVRSLFLLYRCRIASATQLTVRSSL